MRANQRKLPEPERAKTKPKKIVGKGNPGGPHTPGAKLKRHEGEKLMEYRGNKTFLKKNNERIPASPKTKSAGEKGMGSGKGE